MTTTLKRYQTLALLAALQIGVCGVPCYAQSPEVQPSDDLNARIKELEAKVEQLQKKLDSLKAPSANPAAPTPARFTSRWVLCEIGNWHPFDHHQMSYKKELGKYLEISSDWKFDWDGASGRMEPLADGRVRLTFEGGAKPDYQAKISLTDERLRIDCGDDGILVFKEATARKSPDWYYPKE